MHKVFAGSAFALLGATLVMMIVDQDREWRRYQLQAEELRYKKLQSELQDVNTTSFQNQLAKAEAAVQAADEALKAQSAERDRLQTELGTLNGEVQLLERDVKFQNAGVGVARANLDIAVRDGQPTADLQAIFDRQDALARQMLAELEVKKAARDAVKNKLADLTKAYDDALAAKAELQQEVDRINEQIALLRPGGFAGAKRAFKRWPIINGFNPEIRIIQDWIPDLKQQLGMARVARFDRCRTCHVHIDRFATGNVPEFPAGHPDVDGYEQPFSSHPRPDVYVTATSPHPLEKFGCTSCHEGDGSGTSFQTAEHTPVDPVRAKEWAEEHHWHSNHFWEYPMHPKQFVESGCLRCHHSVIELGINEKFGPTAPKLFEGYNLIKDFGCFGCHDINGFDGPKAIGPDLRLEPQTEEEAAKIAADPNQVAGKMRKVGPSLRHIGAKTTGEFIAYWTEEPKRFRPNTRMPQFFGLSNQDDHLAGLLQPVELAGVAAFLMDRTQPLKLMQPREGYVPDAERGKRLFSRRGCLACHSHDDPEFAGIKADFGPNLTKVHEKIKPGPEGFNWVYTWVRDPERHHARTRMPNLFLEPEGEGEAHVDAAADIAAFLLQGGPREFPQLTLPGTYLGEVTAAVTDPAEVDRLRLTGPGGLRVVEVLPGSPIQRVPPAGEGTKQRPGVIPGDVLLSYNGTALSTPEQLRQLEAQTASGTTVTIGISRNGEQAEITPVISTPLEDLTRLYLRKQMTAEEVDATLARGIMSRKRGVVGADGTLEFSFQDIPAQQLKGDEIELVRQEGDPETLDPAAREKRMLLYVGRRTVSRYGCFGCHDIPGYEEARPIGTTMQDWGRKDTSKLAPEHIEEYLHHHGEPDGSSTHERVAKAQQRVLDAMATGGEVNHTDEMAAFFYESLAHHGRAGFFWQKLRDPRSYDYEKIETKGWDERLRMPKFPFTEAQIESIATFVLGLVADPPPESYLYRPEGAAFARIEGERLLEQYNCTACHVLEMPGFRYETDVRGLIGMTRKELVDWFATNADAITSGTITQDMLAQRAAADGTAPSTEAVQPAEFQSALQTFVLNSEVLLDGQLDDVPDVKTGLVTHLAQLAKSEQAKDLEAWLDEHKEVLIVDRLADLDLAEAVRLSLHVKPPVRHGAPLEKIDGPAPIEVHGLVFAEPDPEETDPEFREYAFDLWENMEVGGRYKLTLNNRLIFQERSVQEAMPGRGGDFAHWLVPQLKDNEMAGDQNKSWQAAPPPLYKEGVKVQTPWLFRFLKNPDRLRHTTVLRMPRFNMSDAEAQALANYFAAIDGAEFPYQRIVPQEPGYLAAQQAEFQAAHPESTDDYLGAGWKVLNAPLCVKCHAVGGQPFVVTDPANQIRGPNLDRVEQRLRPDWLRLWIAKPSTITSYTSMPSNFKRGSEIFPELFDGDPERQTEGIVGALLNYYNLLEKYGPTAYQPPEDAAAPDTTTGASGN